MRPALKLDTDSAAGEESCVVLRPKLDVFHAPPVQDIGASLFHDTAVVKNSVPGYDPDDISGAKLGVELVDKPGPYDEGFEAGRRHSQALHDETIAVMQAALDMLSGEIGRIQPQIETDMIRKFSLCMNHLFPAFGQIAARAQVKDILSARLRARPDEEIIIRVNPEAAEIITYLKALEPSPVVLIEDADLQKGQIKLKWKQGGASIDPRPLTAACLAVFEPNGSVIEKEGNPHD